jgi:hypothetical protein
VSGGDDPSGSGRARLPFVVAAVVGVLVVILGTSYFVFVRPNDETAASPTPTPTESRTDRVVPESTPPPAGPDRAPTPDTTPAPGQPSPSGPGSGEPPSTARPDPGETSPETAPRLTFTPLPAPWQPDPLTANILIGGYAQTQVTERQYNGQSDWLAMVACGMAAPEWYDPSDLAASADQAAEWFAAEGFTGAHVTRQTRTSKPITVDGHRGHLLEQQFSYRIEGLDSRGESVFVVVVDLGDGNGGVFLASVPETNPDLVPDVRRAIDSLSVTP